MTLKQQQESVTHSKPMSSYLAPQVRDIPPSGIRKFFDLVGTNKNIITLGVGEPDFVTPWHVREACVYSLERGFTSYTSNAGTPELREAISDYLDERFSVRYDAKNEIIVTVGEAKPLIWPFVPLLPQGMRFSFLSLAIFPILLLLILAEACLSASRCSLIITSS